MPAVSKKIPPLPMPAPLLPSNTPVPRAQADGAATDQAEAPAHSTDASAADQWAGDAYFSQIEASELACKTALAVYDKALKQDHLLVQELANYEVAQSNAALADAARKMGARSNPHPAPMVVLSEQAAAHLEGRTACEALLRRCASLRAKLGDVSAARLRSVSANHAVELCQVRKLKLENPGAELEILGVAFGRVEPIHELSDAARQILKHREAAMTLSREYAALQHRAMPEVLSREYAQIEEQIAHRDPAAVQEGDAACAAQSSAPSAQGATELRQEQSRALHVLEQQCVTQREDVKALRSQATLAKTGLDSGGASAVAKEILELRALKDPSVWTNVAKGLGLNPLLSKRQIQVIKCHARYEIAQAELVRKELSLTALQRLHDQKQGS